MEERVLFEVAIVTLKVRCLVPCLRQNHVLTSMQYGVCISNHCGGHVPVQEDLFPCSAVAGISVSSPQYVDSMSKEDSIGFRYFCSI